MRGLVFQHAALAQLAERLTRKGKPFPILPWPDSLFCGLFTGFAGSVNSSDSRELTRIPYLFRKRHNMVAEPRHVCE